MNLDDAIERCLGLLHEAALDDASWPTASAMIDEACGVGGNALTVGERTGGEHRIHFARLLARGECRQDLAREYFELRYPHDAGMRRLMERPEGRFKPLRLCGYANVRNRGKPLRSKCRSGNARYTIRLPRLPQ